MSRGVSIFKSTWPGATITWLVHWALYLAYTANVGVRELIVGSLMAVAATAAVLLFIRQSGACFHLRWRDLAQAWRLPIYMITGTFEAMEALFLQLFSSRGAPSLVAAVPFEVGDDDPVNAGRRALAVTLTTATPDLVVFGIVKEQRLMLYHQLLPADVPTMTRKLGARP